MITTLCSLSRGNVTAAMPARAVREKQNGEVEKMRANIKGISCEGSPLELVQLINALEPAKKTASAPPVKKAETGKRYPNKWKRVSQTEIDATYLMHLQGHLRGEISRKLGRTRGAVTNILNRIKCGVYKVSSAGVSK